MAPEQVGMDVPIGPATDVYALGVILYECLSGAVPFEGDTMERTLYQIMHGTAQPLAERCPLLPRGLASVVERAMARQRDDRYPSARAFAEALLPFAGGRQASFGEAWWVDVTSGLAISGDSALATSPPEPASSEQDAPSSPPSPLKAKWLPPLTGALGGALAVGVAWWLSAPPISVPPAAEGKQPVPENASPPAPAERPPGDATPRPFGETAPRKDAPLDPGALSSSQPKAEPSASSEATRSRIDRAARPPRAQRNLPPPPSFDPANPYAQ
jgi:serine/threonine-protein kinase